LANNGTLHLPFTTIGLHSDDDAPSLDIPADPPQTASTMSPSPSPSTTNTFPTSAVTPPSSQEPAAESPANPDDEADNDVDDETSSLQSFYDGVKDTLSSIKDWFGQLFSAEKDNHPPS